MATPALRLLRSRLRGSFIGALVRPGLDELLAGTDFFDEVHVASAQGLMGPKRAAAKVRGRAYDTALLLTNSFSTALATRLAFIPRRIGYDRDGRGVLLTDKLIPAKRGAGRLGDAGGGFAPVPMVEYYLRAARAVIGESEEGTETSKHQGIRLELGVTPGQDAAAQRLLRSAGIDGTRPMAVINPGANDVAKRWPAERFAHVAAHLAARGMDIAINGSPDERELVAEVARLARKEVEEHGQDGRGTKKDMPTPGPSLGEGFGNANGQDARATQDARGGAVIAELPALGITIGSLKGVIRRAAVMLTNDTGPRHIGAAFGVPTVTLFGPTDPRWTMLPDDGTARADLVADPALPDGDLADDHPERCRIDRIEVEGVIAAVEGVLRRSARTVHG